MCAKYLVHKILCTCSGFWKGVEMKNFIQIGAMRDGTDPYYCAARKRGIRAILVETPAYLSYRRELGRIRYDCEIPVDHPEDSEAVIAALSNIDGPTLVLAGIDTYTGSTYAVSGRFAAESTASSDGFAPLNKKEQRARIAHFAPDVAQPVWGVFDDENSFRDIAERIGFPMVLKPVNGGGGLGVVRAKSMEDIEKATVAFGTLRNFGDSELSWGLLEHYIDGVEFSFQGIVENGKVDLLSICEKLVFFEEKDGLVGFCEAGHIAAAPSVFPPEAIEMACSAIAALGYRNGPFHIDCVEKDGHFYFLEIGFRLSGVSITRLVELATGRDWSDESFSVHLGEVRNTSIKRNRVVGQVTLKTADEIRRACELSALHDISVERFAARKSNGGEYTPLALRTDFLRLGGYVGRAIVSASNLSAVRDVFLAITADRKAGPLNQFETDSSV
jgi:predicted ATP-grasp superfamily ATP-dependent carboligase